MVQFHFYPLIFDMKKLLLNYSKVLLKNYDSFFLSTMVLFTCINITFSIFKLNNISSLFFKAGFIILALWFLIKATLILINNKFKFAYLIKSKPFIYLLVLLAIFLISGINVLITAYQLNTVITFDFFIKLFVFYASLIFLFNIVFSNKNPIVIRIIISMVLALSLIFLFSYIQGIGKVWFLGNTGKLLYFNLVNPNYAALVLCACFLILMYGVVAFHSLYLRILCGVLGIVIMYFLFRTGSRGPLLAIVVGVVCYLVMFWKKKRFVASWPSSIFVSSFPMIFTTFYIPLIYLYSLISQGGSNTYDYKSIDSRFSVWVDAYQGIMRFPILGNYSNLNGNFQYHNSILDTWVAYGPVVMILTCFFISVLFMYYTKEYKIVKTSQKIALTAFIVSMMTGIVEAAVLSSGSGLYVLNLVFFALAFHPISKNVLEESNSLKNLHHESIVPLDALIINNVYGQGSTGKIIKELYNNLLVDGYKSAVIYGRNHYNGEEINVAKVCSETEAHISHFINNITKNPYGMNFFSTFEIIRIIKQTKPKLIHLHCLNDYYANNYILLMFLKSLDTHVVITLHAENLFIGNCGGHSCSCREWKNNPGCIHCHLAPQSNTPHKIWQKMYRSFDGFKNLDLIAVSPWLRDEAITSPIFRNYKINTILNGVSNDFRFDEEARKILENNFGVFGKKIILHVTASFHNEMKGSKYYIELANRCQQNSNYIFLIASLDQIAEELPKNMIKLPPIKNQSELAAFYSLADVTVITSQWETFSMPVAESLSCGTPVIGFKAGGPETIAIPEFSSFVPFGDVSSLARELHKVINRPILKKNIESRARIKYSSNRMYQEYKIIYEGGIISDSDREKILKKIEADVINASCLSMVV